MMKKIIIIVLFLLSGNMIYAQNFIVPNTYRNNLKAGVTTILFGRGDFTGLNYYNEYNRKVNNYLTLAPAVQFSFGSKANTIFVDTPLNKEPYEREIRFSKGSAAVYLNLYFSPWRFERSKLRIGAGPSLRYISDSLPFEYITAYTRPIREWPSRIDIDYFHPPIEYDRPLNFLTIGYSLVAEGELNVSSHCNLGIRAAFQGYQSGETALMLGVNFGYRF